MVCASSCLERKRSEMKTSFSTGSLEKEESELQVVSGLASQSCSQKIFPGIPKAQLSLRKSCLSLNLLPMSCQLHGEYESPHFEQAEGKLMPADQSLDIWRVNPNRVVLSTSADVGYLSQPPWAFLGGWAGTGAGCGPLLGERPCLR